MKKKYSLLFIVLISTCVKAQKNFPFPSDNPYWIEVHGKLGGTCSPPACGTSTGYYCNCSTPVYYKSDTIINDLKYNRLYSYGICQSRYTDPYHLPEGCPYEFFYQNSESLFATIRQDTINKRVYLWESNKDTLLYDFKNLTVGQPYPKTYNNKYDTNLIVVSEDSLLFNGSYHKKWGLKVDKGSDISDSNFVSIIEGIGSTYGILSALIPPFESWDGLICFSLNNVVIYPDSTYNYCDKTLNVIDHRKEQGLLIYPNPFSDITTIEVELPYNIASPELVVYDVLGAKVKMYPLNKGYNKLTINAKDYSKGVYLCTITGNNMILEKQKMFVIK